MAQKVMEERVGATEQGISELRKELQRLPVLERGMERITEDLRETHRLLSQALKEWGKEQGGTASAVTGMTPEKGENGEEEEVDDLLEVLEEGTSTWKKEEGGVDRIGFKKLEMPAFDGTDPDGWFFRAEHFFQLHHVTEREKLKLAVVSMSGRAIHWFRWAHNRKKFRSWEGLKHRLFLHFRVRKEGTLCARFLAVRQASTVAEYRHHFEELSAPLPHLTEEVLENTFTNGLDSVIRREVFCMRPSGLDEIIGAIQLVEDRLEETSTYWSKNGLKDDKESPRTTNKKYERLPTRTITWEEKATTTRREPGYRRLSDTELRARREKGLCYRCDEKYTVGHRCKNKELRLLVLADDEEEEGATEEAEQEPLVKMTETVELSLNSVVGLTAPGTMKVKGILGGREIDTDRLQRDPQLRCA